MEASLIGSHVSLEAQQLAAEGLPLHDRRQLGDPDPLKVLVTGAAGMLGRDVVRVAEQAGHDVAGARSRRPRHHRCRRRRARGPRRAPGCAHQLRRLDRRRRRRGESGRGDTGERRRRPQPRRGDGGDRVQDRLPLDRLRLRRRQGRALRRVRPRQPALGLRQVEARRRGRDRREQPAPLHRARVVAVRSQRPQLRRHDARPRSQLRTRSSSSPTRSAARPTRGISPRDSCGWSNGTRYGIYHMAGGGECSWYDFAVEIFRQAGVECRVMSATTDMLDAAGAAAGLLGAA